VEGDFYAVVQLEAPKELSSEDREALERMAANLPNPRTGAQWQ
jgi:DnaJ-class molecular chaperone